MKRMQSMCLRLFVTGLCLSVGLSALAQCTGDCDPEAQEQCEKKDGWYWLGPPDCRCQTAESPIIIDLNGKGIRLTDALHGVLFDLENTGRPIRVAWTVPGASNAFLVLDRNHDGRITSGAELFGNFTPQPFSIHPNGFLALAEFDKPENGGNADGVIDEQDAIFASLRLWTDTNQDGQSQLEELFTLPSLGVRSISLSYKSSAKRDRYGNLFSYRAKVNGTPANSSDGIGPWAYDVFLTALTGAKANVYSGQLPPLARIGSTPARRNAWDRLSTEQKQQMVAKFQRIVTQATDQAKAQHKDQITPANHFYKIGKPGREFRIQIQGNTLDNATASFTTNTGKSVAIPSAVEAPTESSQLTSKLPNGLAMRIKTFSLPGNAAKGTSQWRLLRTSWHPNASSVYLRPVQAGQDADGDGIDDGLESQVADSFSPNYHVSAGEKDGTGFATYGDFTPTTILQTFGPTPPLSYYRVTPSTRVDEIDIFDPSTGDLVDVFFQRYQRVDYLTLWNRDDGLVITPSCIINAGGSLDAAFGWLAGVVGTGVTTLLSTQEIGGHLLEDEHSAVLVSSVTSNPNLWSTNVNDYSALAYFTAAHEGTPTDHSAYFVPQFPVPAGVHLDMFLALSKHSTYLANPNGRPILPDSVVNAVFGSLAGTYAAAIIYCEFQPDCLACFDAVTAEYLALTFLADTILFDCIAEHFNEQGITPAQPRINVGELGRPINASGFIADLNHSGGKLSESLFSAYGF